MDTSAAGEREGCDAAGHRDALHGEALVNAFQTVPQPLSPTEDDRDHGQVHGAAQVGGEELAQRRPATADSYVATVRRFPGLLQNLLRGGVDEGERGAAVELDRCPGMVGEDEDRGLERRLLTPPALPAVVAPRAALRVELVAPHDLRSDALTPRGAQHPFR